MLSPGCTPLLGSDPGAIGRYRIIGRLGVGGMATVYLAESEEANRRVALKLVHEHLAADAEFLARFDRETHLAARVPAHCTAALLDKGVHGDRPFLVTEYLAGTPLHRLVEAEGPLDPASAHNIAIGMAAGLTAIHDCDLVHRDIKPSNVMVTRGGVRIIDFGIARTLDTSTDFTRSGFMMGSLGWTSPEQLEGRGPLPAMDVFAWGCVLAYASTGRHPFGGDDPVARSWRILNGEPDLTGVPETIAGLVAAALDRDLGSRPTAQELLLGLVGAATPVVRVRAAVPAAGAGAARAVGPAPRGRRWAFLAVAVPVGVAATVALSASSSNGVMVDRPTQTSSPAVSSGSAPGIPSGSARTQEPTGNGRPGSIATPTDPGVQSPSEPGVQSPSASATGRPGNGNGNGNGNKPSKSPKG